MKLIALSLFSNVGIAESYFARNNIQVAVANELVEERAKFYSWLYPKTQMICGDITNENVFKHIINSSIAKKVNFIIATPPCQGMSQAGSRDPLDKRNFLIYYAVEAIKAIKPCFVIIENVPELLKTFITVDNKTQLISEYIRTSLDNYLFNSDSVISAMDYGIPQIRKRNIYLLVRKDIGFNWNFPKKEKIITLREAIGDLPSLDPILREGYEFTKKVFPDFDLKVENGKKISKWHYPPKHSWKQVEWMIHTPSGKSAIYNEKYYPIKKDGTRVKAHHNNYRRLSWDKPCRTITMNNGVISSLCCVHPGRYLGKDKDGYVLYSDARALSIYELLIVMTLPLNWNIPPWASDTLIRHVIGEGIPPLLIEKLIKELYRMIEEGNLWEKL